MFYRFLSGAGGRALSHLVLHELGVAAVDLHLFHLLLTLLTTQEAIGLQHQQLLLHVSQAPLHRVQFCILPAKKNRECNTLAYCGIVFFKKNNPHLHVDDSLQGLRLGGLWCSLVPTVQLLLGRMKEGEPLNSAMMRNLVEFVCKSCHLAQAIF